MDQARTAPIEIIYGAKNIAGFLGLERRQIYHASDRHGLPVFRIGATLCARPAALLTWIAEQDRKSASPEVVG